MKVCCLSDLHGHLPSVPDGIDLLLIAGDLSQPRFEREGWLSALWFLDNLRAWLDPIADRCPVVFIAGNHDFVLAPARDANEAYWKSKVVEGLRATYLEDSGATVAGLRVYGTPWVEPYGAFAFQLDEGQRAEKWARIPEGIDVLLCHQPPYGVGDWSPYGGVHAGCRSLLGRIEQVRPKLVVCGHLHSGYGVHRLGDTTVVNAAHWDDLKRPIHRPIVVEM
jgi:Icc-related predicted phosphoesterase